MHCRERHRTAKHGGAEDITLPSSPPPSGHDALYVRSRCERRRTTRRVLLACTAAAAVVVLLTLYRLLGPVVVSTPVTDRVSLDSRLPVPSTAEPLRPSVPPPSTTPPTPPSRPVDVSDRRTERPVAVAVVNFSYHEDGEYAPEEPERLPGLQLHRRTFTPAELLERARDMDFIYTFVNGSEVNHEYRKLVRSACGVAMLKAERDAYVLRRSWEDVNVSVGSAAPTAGDGVNAEQAGDGVDAAAAAANSTTTTSTVAPTPFTRLSCMPRALRDALGPSTSLGDFMNDVHAAARVGSDERDRETDELRHSLRSVEQHVRWHRGRVVMVSPGHHPTWLDGARNFLAGACGDAHVQALRSSGTHLRVTTVHQDAVMPYGMRLTADSHVIEQRLWRVRNTTAVHVYMNDDYFVNRDVAVTDLFNEYGGTIVRTIVPVIGNGDIGDGSGSWPEGVLYSQQFNIQELDVQHEDYLPESLVRMWEELGRVAVANSTGAAAGVAPPALSESVLDEAVDVAHHYTAEPLPSEPLKPRRPRRIATHAPFVYCTNMFRFFETRYEREFAAAALHHRSRKARDLFMPFLYNAFIMARPWQASPKFLPYLLELQRSRSVTHAGGAAAAAASITLDNVDGCAPASLRGGYVATESVFGHFVDNVSLNVVMVERINRINPIFFNINAGFSSPEACDQLRAFLHDKFPTPGYLEATTGAAADGGAEDVDDGLEVNADAIAAAAEHDAALHATFDALMALPVVGVVSDAEGVCPLVRSLSLAFAGHHRGGVHVSVVRHGGATLREARAALGHRVVSAMPAPACAYGASVVTSAAAADEAVADVARRVLGGADAGGGGGGVVLPATCGAGGAGLRVRGFVVDARTAGAPVRSAAALREALAVPAQTLALEDFRAVAVGPSAGDVVLVVSREDAAAKAVHWVTGASESDLLVTYPLPVEAYEDMSAPLRWAKA